MSREKKEENSLEKNISLWEGVSVLKGQYTEAERTSKRIALKKYFTLGGCFGTERPIYRTSYKKRKYFTLVLKGQYTEAERASKRIALKKIFHFGRVFWY